VKRSSIIHNLFGGKMPKVNPIPEGYHTVTPYLAIKDADKAIQFYKKALNATELFRMNGPDGKVAHAEIQIGNSRVMLADEFPQMGHMGPKSRGGTTVSFMVYVEDCDRIAKQAMSAGMTEKKAMEDQFYGDRSGTYEDPFGHVWTIGTHKEDLSPEEIDKRAKAKFGKIE
jgi:PhnB protein